MGHVQKYTVPDAWFPRLKKSIKQEVEAVHSFHTTSQHLYLITVENHYQLGIVRPFGNVMCNTTLSIQCERIQI